MSRKIRSAFIVLVLVNLVATAAYALPRVGRQAPPRSEGVFAAAWGWFASVVAPAREVGVQVAWEKAGSQMDPNGTTQPNSSVSGEMTKEGSSMDHNGNK